MRSNLVFPLLLLLLFGCNSGRKSKYNDCMESGMEKLYGDTLTPEFCKCFADGLTRDNSPFAVGNRCSRPIIQKMLEGNK